MATQDFSPRPSVTSIPALPGLTRSAPRGARIGRWVVRGIQLVAVIGTLLFLGGFVMFALSLDREGGAASPQPTDGVVTLTGGQQRIADGLNLLQNGKGKRLLISGVHERTGHDDITRLNPASRILINCCVDLGAQARNTIGNAIEARRWAKQHGFRSMVVVTSNYHMPRVLLEFRHAMPGRDFVPNPVVSEAFDARRWWTDPGMTRTLAAEYVKYLAAWARTHLERDPENSRFPVVFGGRKPISPKVIPGAAVGN